MKSIYLAGFDVFRPDAREWGATLKELCNKYGFEGLYPLDNNAPRTLAGADLALWIYRANIALIQQADMLLANVNAFRGAEPDSGTAFEIGYAVALDKPVWAYTDEARPLVKQLPAIRQPGGATYTDTHGYTIEDFGLNLNLMLACSTEIVIGTAEDALAEMAGHA
ncbi:nucleoside 2-deoxyribosyltransferase [Pollutimonas thiosulfatoxidans]|uniref:Nucleoside 2-deoxyribosyltransferase n=1 Tax=Pollutimonas thiosulfatoxidans TaxID=2028345 RepID=A0A410GF08_9BURK|nr:nucleoside 2-deoxyribosyltransferase [Pollutimonas thiosulfatoxidans]MBF6617182.1 nucleoside 2-deoxyribosyltransferase [Candidimonas sp.]NYT45714.1 nucleoside 2-deoxyribosyltransferase [Alcaligenaceae bacterium]QAA94880.1 nucleoside 2-deoxyribosyltransferase [Pollutimonas thiosulfatoxidans]